MTSDLPLRNGAFTEVVNVSNTRAIVWSHLAHWSASHLRKHLGAEHAGRWSAELHGVGHWIRQDMPVMVADSMPSGGFTLRFSAGAFGSATGTLAAYLELHDASGTSVASRSVSLDPEQGRWREYAFSLGIASPLPEGARLRVAFRRMDAGTGGALAVTGVSATQHDGVPGALMH